MNKIEALNNGWKAYCNRIAVLMDFSAEGRKRDKEASDALTVAMATINKNGWMSDWHEFFAEMNKGNEWWR